MPVKRDTSPTTKRSSDRCGNTDVDNALTTYMEMPKELAVVDEQSDVVLYTSLVVR